MKYKAYILCLLGCLCIMFIGVGYIVSYTDNASLELFDIESRLVIVALLIILPLAGFLLIKKGIKMLNS